MRRQNNSVLATQFDEQFANFCHLPRIKPKSRDRYLVSIPSDSTTATVSAVTGAGAMSLGTFSLPSTGAGATRAMRVRQSGSSLSVWAWNPSGSEPVSPTFSVTGVISTPPKSNTTARTSATTRKLIGE
mgnify:CR=1 FL=1